MFSIFTKKRSPKKYFWVLNALSTFLSFHFIVPVFCEPLIETINKASAIRRIRLHKWWWETFLHFTLILFVSLLFSTS